MFFHSRWKAERAAWIHEAADANDGSMPICPFLGGGAKAPEGGNGGGDSQTFIWLATAVLVGKQGGGESVMWRSILEVMMTLGLGQSNLLLLKPTQGNMLPKSFQIVISDAVLLFSSSAIKWKFRRLKKKKKK